MDFIGFSLIVISVAWAAFVINLNINHPEEAAILKKRLEGGNRRYQSMMGKAGRAAGGVVFKAALGAAKRRF